MNLSLAMSHQCQWEAKDSISLIFFYEVMFYYLDFVLILKPNIRFLNVINGIFGTNKNVTNTE